MILFIIILWLILAATFVITMFAPDEAKGILNKILDRIDGKIFAKRRRRNDIKKKYGFDDSYDKYIA